MMFYDKYAEVRALRVQPMYVDENVVFLATTKNKLYNCYRRLNDKYWWPRNIEYLCTVNIDDIFNVLNRKFDYKGTLYLMRLMKNAE